MLSKTLAGALGASILALGGAASAQAATFTVNDTGNSGPGTLRSAINAANNTAAADVIRFGFGGTAVRTITPTTPLPTLTEPVKINGYSQNGAAEATDTTAATLKIVIDASNVGRGLDVGGDGMEIRGLDIQNAQDVGIYLEGSDNVVAGNHIGTGVNGTAARPNGNYGIQVFAQDNRIGGPDAKDRNVISSNGLAEVYLDSGSGHVVQGNHLGADSAGTGDLGVSSGVNVESSDTQLLDNVISGENTGANIYTDGNVVQGNKIGTNAAGDAALPNQVGLNVIGGDDNQIGGTGEDEGNLISGNDASGLQLLVDGADPAEHNDVRGNLIGVNADDDAKLANGGTFDLPGVLISASRNNTIGGTAAGAPNVISGNTGAGVRILNEGADNNRVLGNAIGTDLTHALNLGNDGAGVLIEDGVNNRVGDETPAAAGNTIAHNRKDGVTVASGTGNAVLRNSIHDNTELAVDLGPNGSTANDDAFHDADTGANDLQNGPTLSGATATDATWALESEPLTRYRLEFYTNPTCTAGGVTEAETYVGFINVTTDANGHADATTPLTLPAGSYVTMTATRRQLVATGLFPPTFTLEPRSTSEVSPCELVA
jgi:hypothetical protein